MSDPAPPRAAQPWQQGLDAATAELKCSVGGLTDADAARRIAQYGRNELRTRTHRAIILQLLSRFANPLILLLLAAASISAFTGDVTSFVVILLVITLSVTLDFVQEFRAGRAAERLQQSVALRVTLVRNGREQERLASEVVPGDVVLVRAGDLVPADGLVLESRDLFVQQAVLTGEPYPVEKHAAEKAGPDAAPDVSSVFMGTSVLSGGARLLVCRTGRGTALGEISRTLTLRPPMDAFQTGVRSFGLLILRLAAVMVVLVLVVNAVFHRPWLESFLFAIALAVGLTPELLPMVVTITLSRGAIRMARARVIVKRLAAVHDLGSMDVLCTDKTGTLTAAQIHLEKHLDPLGQDSARVLELLAINSALQTGLRNPLDQAVLKAAPDAPGTWKKVDELPFDFVRRRLAILADDGRERRLVVKGALEEVLRVCTRLDSGGVAEPRPLDDAARAAIRALYQALGQDGLRVLGVAWKPMDSSAAHLAPADEAELIFAGLAAFEDPPKPGAAEAIHALAHAGVTVKIITGDSELVTQHVCGELKLAMSGVLLGDEIEAMDDSALDQRVEATSLFCRVTPAQKNRVILALKRRGHAVGYLGDGINDAPALHSADVGLSVDGAVDVAKEAADMILLDTDLGVLLRGVLEGRRTLGNILKYVRMGTSSNFGNMFSMAGGTVLLPFLPMLPVQILVNNLLYDVSEIPIPLERVDRAELERPRRWDVKSIRNFMLVVGPVSSVFDFLMFFVLRQFFHASEVLFHTGWFVESLATQVLVIFVIRTRGNPLRSRPAALLTLTSLGVVALAAALPYTPLGARLGFAPLPAALFPILGAMVLAYLVMVQLVKRWFYRRFEPVTP